MNVTNQNQLLGKSELRYYFIRLRILYIETCIIWNPQNIACFVSCCLFSPTGIPDNNSATKSPLSMCSTGILITILPQSPPFQCAPPHLQVNGHFVILTLTSFFVTYFRRHNNNGYITLFPSFNFHYKRVCKICKCMKFGIAVITLLHSFVKLYDKWIEHCQKYCQRVPCGLRCRITKCTF